MSRQVDGEEIREAVRAHYAAAARQVLRLKRQGAGASCCGAEATSCGCSSARLYDPELLRELPEAAVLASMGCGNPLLLADLRPGETVLDLGSGGGIDVLLSARRVGPSGKAYGLDMTDEMLELARENAEKAGVTNVEFLKGHIESVPLPDESVDVIISNCVINLSADKHAVLAEAYRVLRPGGRFAVTDVVVQGGALSDTARQLLSLWAECTVGALTEEEYRSGLAAVGFEGVEMQVLKEYGPDDVAAESGCCGPGDLALEPGTRIVSAFVKATKPA